MVADKNKSNDEFCFSLRPITVCAFPMRRPADGSARGSVGGCFPGPIILNMIVGGTYFWRVFCLCTYNTIHQYRHFTSTGTYKYKYTRVLEYIGNYVDNIIQVEPPPVVFSTAVLKTTEDECTYFCTDAPFEFDAPGLMAHFRR